MEHCNIGDGSKNPLLAEDDLWPAGLMDEFSPPVFDDLFPEVRLCTDINIDEVDEQASEIGENFVPVYSDNTCSTDQFFSESPLTECSSETLDDDLFGIQYSVLLDEILSDTSQYFSSQCTPSPSTVTRVQTQSEISLVFPLNNSLSDVNIPRHDSDRKRKYKHGVDKIVKKQQNQQAAQRYRNKKKIEQQETIRKEMGLIQENEELKRKLTLLRAEKEALLLVVTEILKSKDMEVDLVKLKPMER